MCNNRKPKDSGGVGKRGRRCRSRRKPKANKRKKRLSRAKPSHGMSALPIDHSQSRLSHDTVIRYLVAGALLLGAFAELFGLL